MSASPARARGGRSRGASRRRGQSSQIVAAPDAPLPASHITAIGVKRPNYGTSGKALAISVNAFPTTVPETLIYHYHVDVSPSTKPLPARLNMRLMNELQTRVDPQVFTPRAVYDGRKNLFSIRSLPLGEDDTKEYSVSLSDNTSATHTFPGAKASRTYKVKLTKVAQVNSAVLNRFVSGDQSHDNAVVTAIMALNVAIRMYPSNNYPFNARSFFTKRETKDIPGSGLQLWRGYFQSLRPAIGRMLINVDISTGAMYKPGPLIDLCLEFLGVPPAHENMRALVPGSGLTDRDRLRLQRFVAGVRVITRHAGGDGRTREISRIVKKLSMAGAQDLHFDLREGGSMSVADYFRSVRNRPLRYPRIICVEVGSGALIPLELCEVREGQLMRSQFPQDKIKSVLDFASKPPNERCQSILDGREVLAYGQSEYIRQFGMQIDTEDVLRVQARILPTPLLEYGAGSRDPVVRPNNDGMWNMAGKRFIQPAEIKCWAIVVFDNQRRFSPDAANVLLNQLTRSFNQVGIRYPPVDQFPPVLKWVNPQGRVAEELRAAGNEARTKYGQMPNLLLVILPEGGNDIYTKIKHFGDVTVGVATQCLKSQTWVKPKSQYYENLTLKINVKLGGINNVPERTSAEVLSDPANPTIVMGADAIHPTAGSNGKPSFTALVGSVDSNTAKYVASTRVQRARQEIIEDLEEMAKDLLVKYMSYRSSVEKKHPSPKRIIFYRDGVSEGQFPQVLKEELGALKSACNTLKIDPKITFIVVGKRHHVRLFPRPNEPTDRSGNCPPGTVVDRDIVHPVEFDFYLQSHGGRRGTSRPAHYSVLHDENNFSADALQSISFALCHVYVRCTRSISIPAPVYYADIVCSRARNHYDPESHLDLSATASQADSAQAGETLEAYRTGFLPVNQKQERLMYFC